MSTVDIHPSPSFWRHFSSTAKLSTIRGSVYHSATSANVGGLLTHATNTVGAMDERRQSWRAWATQKIRGRVRSPQGDPDNEVLTLFPGWAARKYAVNTALTTRGGEPVPFEVEAFVSGYAITHRSREQASRSQRAFIRIAKGFAALPRIVDKQSPVGGPSTEDLLNQVNIHQESSEFRVLDQHFRSLGSGNSESESEPDFESPPASPQLYSLPSPNLPQKQPDTPADVLKKLHHNLESRLQLFWSSTLPSRTVRLHLFASPHNSLDTHPPHGLDDFEYKPLASQDVITAVDGSFTSRFRVPWQDLCRHPIGVRIAFCETLVEHDLVIVAELLPPSPVNSPETTSSAFTPAHFASSSHSHTPSPHHHYHHYHHHPNTRFPSHSRHQHHPHLHNIIFTTHPTFPSSPSSSFPLPPPRFLTPTSTTYTHATIPITHSPIRIISDIDDTVKHSGITEGARTVFHNVFVKELKDGVIPGMGNWYSSMWEKGARFHYVSNGPYEYLSLLHEFFEISKLPPGSIKLKSYAGRSLLSGLLSNPAARKRGGVVEILDSFPDSKFILIGDSGEQDLELYAELAKERPGQILAVFIRDVDETSYVPIDDPTGWGAIGAGARYPTFDRSLTTSSSPALASGGDGSTTPRFRNTKRAFSDTFASMRASVSSRSSTVNESTDTPKQQQFPTFTISSPTPNSLVSSPSASVSSLSTTSSASSPASSTPLGYITTPPPPVPPPHVPSTASTSYFEVSPQRSMTDSLSPSQPQRLASASVGYRPKSSRPPPSPMEGATATSSLSATGGYYKPETPSPRHSFFAGFGNERKGSGTGGMSARYIAEGGSSASSGSSGSWIGGAGGSGGGRLSESEKKRQELQMRVCRARTQMPGSVRLRVFRDPSECAEEVDLLLLVRDR